MADEIKLQVSVSGSPTIQKLKDEIKKLNKEFLGLSVDNIPRQKELGASIVSLKDQVASLTKVTLSSNAQMKESYFALGTELRSRATPAVVSLSQAFQDSAQFSMGFGQGLRAVANNVEYLSQQLILLHQKAGSSSAMFTAIGQAIKGPMGILLGISLASSGLQLLTQWFANSAREAEKAKESNEKLTRSYEDVAFAAASAAVGVPGGDILSALSAGQALITSKKAAYERLSGPRLKAIADAKAYGHDIQMKPSADELTAYGEWKGAQSSVDTLMKIFDKKAETAEKIAKISQDELDTIKAINEGYAERYFGGGSPFSLGKSGFDRGLAGQFNIPKMGESGVGGQGIAFGTLQEEVDKANSWMKEKDESEKTFDYISSAARSAGHAISSSIGGALRESLGLGKDLGDQILGIFLQLGLNIATGGLMSELGIGGYASGGSFITRGPALIPSRGGMALVGESGPERIDVTPMRQSRLSRGGGGGSVNVTGQFEVKGQNLVLVLDKARQIQNLRKL
jgi:hypothetical protein